MAVSACECLAAYEVAHRDVEYYRARVKLSCGMVKLSLGLALPCHGGGHASPTGPVAAGDLSSDKPIKSQLVRRLERILIISYEGC
jgi:hypothetical protein